MSTAAARGRLAVLVTRQPRQVGKPWIWRGLFARANRYAHGAGSSARTFRLALAEPEPLTLAKSDTKAFTSLADRLLDGHYVPAWSMSMRYFCIPTPCT